MHGVELELTINPNPNISLAIAVDSQADSVGDTSILASRELQYSLRLHDVTQNTKTLHLASRTPGIT